MAASADSPRAGELPQAFASRVELTRDGLIARMKSGAFPSGRLPREETLAKEQNVSRTTVRGALQSLERDGVVSRRHGIGTFINFDVLYSPIPLNRLAGFDQLIQEAGATASVEITGQGFETGPALLAAEAESEGSQSHFVVTKVFSADGSACARVRDVFPESSLSKPIVPGSMIPASSFAFAERYCVESIDYALAEIRISIADEGLGEILHVEPGTPLLHLKERHYSVSGHLLGYSFIDSLTSPMRLMVLRRNG